MAVKAPSPSFQVKKSPLAERAVSKESMLKSQFGAYAGGGAAGGAGGGGVGGAGGKKKKKSKKKHTVAQLKKKTKKKKKFNPYASKALPAEDKGSEDFPAPPERVEQPKSEWKALLDQASGRTYYWNQVSNQTTWEVPAELASVASSGSAAEAQIGGVGVGHAAEVEEKNEEHEEEEEEDQEEEEERSPEGITLIERDLGVAEATNVDVEDRSNDDAFFKTMRAKKAAEQAQKEEAERRKLASMDEEDRAVYLAKKAEAEKHEKQKARMVRWV